MLSAIERRKIAPIASLKGVLRSSHFFFLSRALPLHLAIDFETIITSSKSLIRLLNMPAYPSEDWRALFLRYFYTEGQQSLRDPVAKSERSNMVLDFIKDVLEHEEEADQDRIPIEKPLSEYLRDNALPLCLIFSAPNISKIASKSLCRRPILPS